MKRQIFGSLAVGIVAGGVIWTPLSIWYTRTPPRFVSLMISNPQFHAGEAVETEKHTVIPADCIPKTKRWLDFDDGYTELLTDAAGPNNGPLAIPTTPRLHLGCGVYKEQMVGLACGWLSGILPPMADTSKPVSVCVLPALPPPFPPPK